MELKKIPKIIHYCWFGGKEKPDIVKKCQDSWHVFLREYEIIEWNEENFDLTINPYVLEAYQAGKYAFVSDYVRVHSLFNHGGIYLDTDVEVFKSFDNLLHHESFWGFEQENYIATSTIGSKQGNTLIKEFLDSYQNKHFKQDDGSLDDSTNVAIVTEILEKWGLLKNGEYQEIIDIGVFYPQTYFSPYDYINCRTFMTKNTYTLHHFYKSWLPARTRIKSQIKVYAAKIIGGDNIAKIRKYYTNLNS
ncbi:capsular polysaccharide synthesis protein [Peribacillus sp. FSL H8-0477]|uniref:glycosyltransferase family 32 protein n=1 Tax=Peribacillus sp. FSL H8-0477 TaxID=2921388 RepID=UPI0030F5D38F